MNATATSMLEQAEWLVDRLDDARVTARLLGGLAVALRCPSTASPSPLARSYSDFDIVVDKRSRGQLADVLDALGYRPVERFNMMNGQTRQLYVGADGVELDVFVERFSLCHDLDLKERLAVDERTLPLADLVLTKLQVAELTRKDVVDVVAIAVDHELRDDDAGISVPRITQVTGGDWGWWRTVTENLEKVLAHVDQLALPTEAATRASATIRALLERIHQGPKSLRWKARAAIGDRMAWREEPDEKRTTSEDL